MFCKYCGSQIDDNSIYCFKCGKKIENKSIELNTLISTNNKITICNPEEERKGLLIYLKDIRTLELIIVSLQNKLNTLYANKPYSCFYKFYEVSNSRYGINEWYNDYSRNISIRPIRQSELYHFVFMFNGTKYGFCIRSSSVEFEKMLELNEANIKKLTTAPVATYGFLKCKGNDNESFWSAFDGRIHDNFSSDDLFLLLNGAKFYLNFFLESWANFKSISCQGYQDTLSKISKSNKEIAELEKALKDAQILLQKEYSLNIIPSKFRGIEPIYYITDYFESSNESLSSILFHLDLDQIKLQIGSVIENQRQEIINQAILISQNDMMISQNVGILKGLSAVGDSIDRNTSAVQNAASWANIAANNAEANAWISAASYLFK